MTHYRTITIDDEDYKYCVGRWRTNIQDVGVFKNDQIGTCVDISRDKYSVKPAQIEAAIREATGRKEVPALWDVPLQSEPIKIVKKAKVKKDEKPDTRGFQNLIGLTITAIQASSINEVILFTDHGGQFVIEVETDGPLGLPVVRLFDLNS